MADQITTTKNMALVVLAFVGATISDMMGGWTQDLTTLVIFMCVDYASGWIAAAVFKKSTKTETGTLSSVAGFKGLAKKGAELLVVLVAARLDLMAGDGHIVRNMTVIFLLGNEGLSILENLGLMGVPIPAFIKNALQALKDKSETES